VTADVIVAGAGPAGALTATILARAGARVDIFDRARFPRPKLCGDTLNPGAMRVLVDHVAIRDIDERATLLDGMILTGGRVEIRGTYRRGLRARALVRRDLDLFLLNTALAAGAQFHDATVVAAPVMCDARVSGVVVKTRGDTRCEHRAALVIAADGRESRLARAVGLARHPRRPRRWAIGGYFEGVDGLTTKGEMHVRAEHYIGVAPVPGGMTNACLVVPHDRARSTWTDPAAMLCDALRADARLRDRFAHARLVEPPQVLGPMAVDAHAPGVAGMLLAGDAAGFIDPITGDGLHFALLGACLTAGVAAEVLGGRLDPTRAVIELARRRRAVFAAKWRFNRAIRALVASPAGVDSAALAARVFPEVFERIIRYAGDCRD
jgi:flavin-dependent dehydrogenase